MEVLFDKKAGYFKETKADNVMEKVDEQGKIIGFSILNFNAVRHGKPISVSLKGWTSFYLLLPFGELSINNRRPVGFKISQQR